MSSLKIRRIERNYSLNAVGFLYYLVTQTITFTHNLLHNIGYIQWGNWSLNLSRHVTSASYLISSLPLEIKLIQWKWNSFLMRHLNSKQCCDHKKHGWKLWAIFLLDILQQRANTWMASHCCGCNSLQTAEKQPEDSQIVETHLHTAISVSLAQVNKV